MKVPFSFMQGSTLSPQALSWQTRIIAAGGTIDSGILTIIDENLIKPMVSSGIFNCLDKMHLFAGTNDRIAAKINLINSSYTAVEVNPTRISWVNNNGFYSYGTTLATGGYLTFGYNPATAPKWSADRFNCSQFIYGQISSNSVTTNMMGQGSGTSTRNAAIVKNTSGQIIVYMNNTAATGISGGTSLYYKNWLCGTRTANTVRAIVNTTSNSYTIAPTASILSQEIGELAILGNTSTTNLDANTAHMASGHGNNNFDNQLLRTYVINTFAALGI
tara:strand:+ start:678 stop:1502 length:825 start_codon:yes stop_codon:yes gene_type:complete